MMRRLTNGIEIGNLRLFWFPRRNWRTKSHPYWFHKRWRDVTTYQSGPFELWYHHRREE